MSLFFFLNSDIIEGKREVLFISRAFENFCFHVSSRWGSVLGKSGYEDIAFFPWPLEIAFFPVRIL